MGTSGHETVSKLGESIAPPPQKDETFYPFLVVCATTIAGMFWFPDLLPRFGFDTFSGLSSFSLPIVAVSCAVGLIVGFVPAARAINFNVLVRPRLLEKWARGTICNRCGHRFNRSRTAISGSQGDPNES